MTCGGNLEYLLHQVLDMNASNHVMLTRWAFQWRRHPHHLLPGSLLSHKIHASGTWQCLWLIINVSVWTIENVLTSPGHCQPKWEALSDSKREWFPCLTSCLLQLHSSKLEITTRVNYSCQPDPYPNQQSHISVELNVCNLKNDMLIINCHIVVSHVTQFRMGYAFSSLLNRL